MDEYPVPVSDATSELSIKNSRFIGIIRRCDTVDAARSAIAEIRSVHPDASHHVYAFKIGSGNSVHEGLSDDGEPHGTAGQPVMNVLRGSGLGDALIVVVRYFGGTKLGTGGLVRAYTDTANAALHNCKTEMKIAKTRLTLRIAYAQYDRISRILPQYRAQIIDSTYSHDVSITAELPSRQVAEFLDVLRDVTGGSAHVELY